MNAAPASRDAGPPDASGRDADGQDIDGQDIDGQDIDGQDALARAACLPIWSGPVDPQPLGGGITNTNFTVVDRGRRVVVRIGGDIPIHQISRANELAASRAAFAAGVSPEVLHAEPGALVLDFVEGRTFAADDVREPRNLEALIDLVRRCHRDIPRICAARRRSSGSSTSLRDYAHTLAEGASRHRPLLPRLLAEAEALEAAVGPVEIVFGHNDLLRRQLHRRRQPPLAGRLGLCRLQLAAVRPRRPRLQRRARPQAGQERLLEPISTAR